MRNPWLGLKSYEEGDHLYGRGKEADELANIVMNSFHTIIYGKSGIGKTSLLRAGVFPTLRYEDFLPIYIRLEHDENADEDSYLRQIENALKENQCSCSVETGLAPSSGKSAPSLQSIFSKYLFNKSRGISLTPVIVFDQFEEIFTLNENRNSAAVERFFADLSDILNEELDGLNYRLVFCLREDYLYYIERLSESIPAFKRNRYCLQDLTHDEAMEVITLDNCNSAGVETRPATSPGTYVDVNTAEEILRKISPDNAEEYNATILSLYMSQLFDKMFKAGATTITSSLVQQFGDDIISAFYFDSIAGISEKSIEYLEDHLVTTGGYRHNVPLEDAISGGVKSDEIEHLKERRIINVQPRQGNVLYMEYAHDVLCPIIVENRSKRILKKKNKRQRRMITAAVVSLLCVLGIMGGFVLQNKRIKEQKEEVLKKQEAMMLMQSRAMAEKADHLFSEGNCAEGVALCLRALPQDLSNPDRPISSEALNLLYSFYYSDFVNFKKVFQERDRWYYDASFSPDNRNIVLGCNDGMVKIVSAETGKQIMSFRGHRDGVYYASYSLDGKYIYTCSYDSTARIWDAATGKQVKSMCFQGYDLAFSPNGKYIATISTNDTILSDTIKIWNVKTGKVVRILKEHSGHYYADFSLDGRFIKTCSYDSIFKIWNVATGEPLITLKGSISGASFSNDGNYVAIPTSYNEVSLWNTLTGKLLKTFKGNTSTIYHTCFSPDGCYLASSSDEDTVRIWNVATGEQVKSFKVKQVGSISFSPNGRYLLTNGSDVSVYDIKAKDLTYSINAYGYVYPECFNPKGKDMALVRHIIEDGRGGNVIFGGNSCVYNIDNNTEVYKIDKINGTLETNYASYSPDGKYLLVSYTSGDVKIMNSVNGKLVREFKGHLRFINSSKYSPDGRYIVTASNDSTAKIWNASTGDLIRTLKGHKGVVSMASFSPDGKYIVTSSHDSTAILWNVSNGNPVKKLKGHSGILTTASFSPDGKQIITTSNDGTAKIWDVRSGNQIKSLNSHYVYVLGASYSPDGQYIVISCPAKSIIYEVSTWNRIREIDGRAAAFTPDGRYIVTGTKIKFWRFCKPQEVIDHFRKVVGDYEFTEDEEIKYYLK